jgi:threonine/homoserine/homoserine lactone efflux protein
MNWQLFTAFLLITLVLFLIPGPIVTLVIATTVNKGLRAGLVTVAGTSCGTAVLLAVIAFGLSWILNHALQWFEMLRWVGAVYLIWLGEDFWSRCRTRRPSHSSRRFCRNSSIRACRPRPSSRSCAWFRCCWGR